MVIVGLARSFGVMMCCRGLELNTSHRCATMVRAFVAVVVGLGRRSDPRPKSGLVAACGGESRHLKLELHGKYPLLKMLVLLLLLFHGKQLIL
jgi:hypothetical protein